MKRKQHHKHEAVSDEDHPSRKEVDSYVEREQDEGREAMNSFFAHMMQSTHFIDGMLDAFTSEHRTNQQTAVRLVVTMLCRWAELDKARYTDGRNEASFEFARTILENEKAVFPFI